MTELVLQAVPAMSPAAIDKVRRLEAELLKLPQLELRTTHALHGGMYARTLLMPAGTIVTGVLIKVPTIMIVSGAVLVYIGTDEPLELVGYNVIPASAGRRQVVVAICDTEITAVFPTDATTIDEAERAFSDEFELLAARRYRCLDMSQPLL